MPACWYAPEMFYCCLIRYRLIFTEKVRPALSIKEPAEIGKNHGVYRVDGAGNVGGFLHKKTVNQLQELGAVDTQENVDIDTGAVILDSDILKSLYSLIDTDEKFSAYVNEKARLSFYADFLYPLASSSTLKQYYKETPEGDFTPELYTCRTELWKALHPYQMKLIRMSPGGLYSFWNNKRIIAVNDKTNGRISVSWLEFSYSTNRDAKGVCGLK